WISNKVAVLVIAGDGPERLHGWQLIRCKVHAIAHRARQGMTISIGRVTHVDGIFGRVRTDGNTSSNGPAHVVRSVAPHSALKRCPAGLARCSGRDECFEPLRSRLS